MESKPKILIVEDEKVVQDILKRLMRPRGYQLTFVDRGDEGIQRIKNDREFHLVITDLMLPGASGLELLAVAREQDPDLPVILITAYATVDSAVDAMKGGAFDYLTKPFNNEEVMLVIEKALEKRRLVNENRSLKRELNRKYGFENIIGRSQVMMDVFDLISQAAPSNATILIRGESGTGKELIARAIHHNSPRKEHPFVTLNAGAIPSELLESQLFGHVKGSFTGATSDKKGLCEVADTGSLFLDEIGNISLELQAKLLRVIQEKEIMPVGSTTVTKIDVRLICATNADLERMVSDGQFREDLYYRLNVIEIALPALRERMEDLPLLIDHFIGKYSKENLKTIQQVDSEFLEALESYHWPGNVRELENLIERAVVLSRDGAIRRELLPPQFLKRLQDGMGFMPTVDFSQPLHLQLQTFERALIVKALNVCDGVQKSAAQLLGVKTTTLNEMLKRHKLR
ncbi:MAG: sigma-54-dependent Fis family transcriptional regulator [Acidobacteria bacterium]|nr:sigma-54-dependent Fis family transcriptional regulator [Acidobacteriota bacterium]